MTPETREERARTGTVRRGTQVLLQLNACLGETAEALAGEPYSERARTAVALLGDAREALLPLLQERGEAAAPPEAVVPPAGREVELAPDDGASRRARAFCRAVLDEWALPGGTAQAAVDVASELVTNAARHATTSIGLRLERSRSGVVVSAWDDGPGRPHLLPHRPGTTDRGIGLHWVEALTASWGWTDERDGKRVWGVVPIPR